MTNSGEQLLAEDATLEGCSYLQAVHWRRMQHWKGMVIGMQCAVRGCNNSGAQLLASSALAEGLTIEECNYLARSALMEDVAMTEACNLLAASAM
jgi:hypothetical protein